MDWLDRAAMAGSAACMVHCLALPLLLAAVPAAAAIIVIPESFHRWVLLLAVPLAAIALLGGRARHAALWPLYAGRIGLGLMTVGGFSLSEGGVERAVTVTNGILVVLAHAANLRLRHGDQPGICNGVGFFIVNPHYASTQAFPPLLEALRAVLALERHRGEITTDWLSD